jgi:hypothetical protein
MRLHRLLPLLLLPALLACGPGKLSRREAENDIRQDYPVQVTVRVPAQARAAKGSPEDARLAALQGALVRSGWFTVARAPEGDFERFRFDLAPSAPKAIHAAAAGGFELPVAEAEFVRVLPQLETTTDGLRVTYLIRLVRPTPLFPVFQELHPDVRVGETKERHASYRKDRRGWVLAETDEAFRKQP